MSYPMTPKGVITLCKTKLEDDYKNILSFENPEKQLEYFRTLKGNKQFNNYNYIKKEGTIDIESPVDDIREYNYLFYQNMEYSNKIYYCFIKDMIFLNAETTRITFETDVTQTYQFNINFNETFIEREHTNNDTIGANTIPESLEHGPYTCRPEIQQFGIGKCSAVICMTENIFRGETNYPSQIMNGVPTGLFYYVVGDSDNGGGTSISFIGYALQYAVDNKNSSLIDSIYMIPNSLLGDMKAPDYWDYAIKGGFSYAAYHLLDTYVKSSILMETKSITKIYDNLDGYVPKNKKLFTYPYNYLVVDNNAGASFEYKYEDFQSSDIKFEVKGCITPGASIRAIPKDYQNVSLNNSCGINAGKLPIGSYNTDVYTNWLTQMGLNNTVFNSIHDGIQKLLPNNNISELGNIIGQSMPMVNTIGSSIPKGPIGNTAMSIGNTLHEVYEHSRIPNQVEGNTNSGDVTYSSGLAGFTAYYTSIKQEYAKVIDKYFDMYGYATHMVKTPNIFGRKNWNYVKTISCNFTGDIPQNDLRIIKEIFNNGTTIWHNANTMYDYSQNNDII